MGFKKKTLITISTLILIFAFPISFISKEYWGLSDDAATIIQSFLVGVAVGLLISSIFMSSNKTKTKEPLESSESGMNDTNSTNEI